MLHIYIYIYDICRLRIKTFKDLNLSTVDKRIQLLPDTEEMSSYAVENDMVSPAMLRSVDLQLVIDVSGQIIHPIFKPKAVRAH